MGVASTGVAAQGAFLTELFPAATRYSGIAFAREIVEPAASERAGGPHEQREVQS